MKWFLNILLLASVSAHAALEVYDTTCALPKAPVHKFYIDPVKGDDVLGDGTALKPWKTIQSVFTQVTVTPAVAKTATTPAIPAVMAGPRYNVIPYSWIDPVSHARVFIPNPANPVAPGDAIELATGNYGAVAIGVYTFGINPSSFLTIEPAPGAKPVLSGINMSGVGHLYFHDIKVQNTANGGTLVALSAQGAYAATDKDIAQFPAQDVILDRMTFNGTDADPSTWTANDWNTKPANGVFAYPFTTRCISVTNSSFAAIAGIAGAGGERFVFSHNKGNYFRDDGVDYYGNFQRFQYNTLTNSVATTAIHKDFFQGQIGHRFPGTTTNHYHDILIDHNTLLGKTEAKNQFYTYTQGINTFDEDWTNMIVTNNIVVAASCHGIGFGSVHGGEIANNIVLHDHLTDTPGCINGSIGAAGTTHESTLPTNNIRIHHNLSESYVVDLSNGNTWDNNLCTGNSCQWVPITLGVPNWGYSPAVGDTNKNDKQFVQYAPSAYRFNLAPVAGSLAQTMKAGVQ